MTDAKSQYQVAGGATVPAAVTMGLDANGNAIPATDTGTSHFAVTPSDTVDFTQGQARALYVGTGGDVVVVDPAGTAVTYKNAPSGGYILTQCIRVNATNTNATDIVGII